MKVMLESSMGEMQRMVGGSMGDAKDAQGRTGVLGQLWETG